MDFGIEDFARGQGVGGDEIWGEPTRGWRWRDFGEALVAAAASLEREERERGKGAGGGEREKGE